MVGDTERAADLLGVNERHGGRCWSLVQVAGLSWLYAIVARRRG